MASGEIGDENNPDRRTMLRRQAWQRRLHGGRWAAINWPKSWGGREATVMQNTIYSEEMARAKTPGIYNANGLWQIGPMILRWGTEEQQQMWLPGILNADVHWCQGFTEPEAGSDLANLRTLAVLDGDEYVVTGRKIWISTAHLAKWGLFLVRTDPTAIERGAKHEGITALIVDMELPGIEVNVIRDITGGELFCEVNFDGARVPAAYRLGEENQGWNVAMGTLANERVGTSGLSVSMRIELDNLIATARQHNPGRARRPRDPRPHRPAVDPARAHPAAQRPGPVEDPEGREELARGAAGQAAVELPVADHRRARRGHPGRVGRAGARRPRRRGQGPLEPQLRVAALHLDRRGHDRGAEEHHRRPRHQDAPPLSAAPGSPTGRCGRGRRTTPPWPRPGHATPRTVLVHPREPLEAHPRGRPGRAPWRRCRRRPIRAPCRGGDELGHGRDPQLGPPGVEHARVRALFDHGQAQAPP